MKKFRLTVDICMTLALPMLMAYSLIGEMFHEAVGTVMICLFVTHHVLNRRWFSSLTKGVYSPYRIYSTILNLLLFAVMVLQPLTGIFISRHLFTFLPVLSVTAGARTIHLVIAYWGFVLMSLHAGNHLTVPFKKLNRKKPLVCNALQLVLTLISIYGITAFVRRQFMDYMFLRTGFVFFDYSEPLLYFFVDYFAIMVLFSMAGYCISRLLSRKK